MYAKILKETATEETIGFVATLLSLVTLQLGSPVPQGAPLATPMHFL